MTGSDLVSYLAREKPAPPPDCKCVAFTEPNPTCPPHGWWNRDPHVLDLADLTRELGSALAAAQQTFGERA